MGATQLAHSGDTFSCTETSCTINPTELEAYHESHHVASGSGPMMAGMGGLGFLGGSTATTAILAGWLTWLLTILLLIAAIRVLWKLGSTHHK